MRHSQKMEDIGGDGIMQNIYVLCLFLVFATHVGIANRFIASGSNKVPSISTNPDERPAGSQSVNEFVQALQHGREDVQRQAFHTTLFYTGLRVFLIIFSGLAAFGKNFKGTRFKALSNWIPIFALLVAIGTGLDTFIKLGQRRSGHLNYVSNVEDIEMQAKRILSTGAMTVSQLQELEERYSAVKAQHRRETAF